MDDPNAFDYRFATRPLGGTAQIDVQRGGKPLKVDDLARDRTPNSGRNELVVTARSPFQGAKVSSITPAVADELHLDADTEGVVITDLGDDSAAAQCRLPEGRHHPRRQQPEDRQDRRPRKGGGRTAADLAHHAGARWPADQRHAGRMSSEATTGDANSLCRGGARPRGSASAAGPAAPARAVGGRRPGSYPRSRWCADAHAGDAHARIAGVLGPARHRQDHGGAAARRCDRSAFRADLRGVLRRRRPEEGVRRRARPPRDGQGHAAVRRRGASLQPRPAGFVSAGDGGRHRRDGRRDHRKPVLRAQRGVAVARARAGVSLARCRRDRKTVRACRGGRGPQAAAR